MEGSIYGLFNSLDQFRRIIPWTKRSHRELVGLVMEATGQQGPPFGLDDAFPPVNWVGITTEGAMKELAKMGEQCQV